MGWLRVAAVALCLLSVAPAGAQSLYTVDVRQVDPSDFPTIKVYVAVHDEAGQPVPNLAREQFQLRENGRPVEIIDFKGSGSVPITMLLVIDRSGSMKGAKLTAATGAARVFVEQMRAEDRVALMVFSDSVGTAQPFTNDKAALRRAINAVQADGGTAWYDAAWASLDEINQQSGRRGVILLTDGVDNREGTGWLPFLGGAGSRRAFDELIDHAAQQAVPTYVIGLGERGSRGNDGIDESRLQKLAEVTHGRYYFMPGPDQLRALYADLSAGFQKEYEITFKSANPSNNGTWRDIDVIVGGAVGGMTGRGSSGYLETHVLPHDLLDGGGSRAFDAVDVHPSEHPAADREQKRRGRPAPHPPADPLAPVRPARVPAFCARCGAALRPGAKFCGRCGRAVAQQP